MRRDPCPPLLPARGEPCVAPRAARWSGTCRSRLPTEDELFAMRRAAWLKQGVVMIRLADVPDEWVRQALINAGDRLYGRRETA